MSKKRLACFITGVPRGDSRCMPTLRFLLDDYDVDYFAVMREEFATEEVKNRLMQAVPGVSIMIVPLDETQKALASIQKLERKPASTTVQMWHEVWFAVSQLQNLDQYDLVFRTRFDMRFAPQFLPDIEAAPGVVWIPERFSWSGSNDMICLAGPQEFAKYANVFNNLETMVKRGNRVPEHLVSQSLCLESLCERSLDLTFMLFRELLHDGLTDLVLDTLCFTEMGTKSFKLEKLSVPTFREEVLRDIIRATDKESCFPIFQILDAGTSISKPFVDPRDSSVFRFIVFHFYMRRALKNVRAIRFKIHYMAKNWSIDMLTVTIDGYPVKMSIIELDEHKRPIVQGNIDASARFHRPWSKIGIAAGGAGVDATSKDKRRFSIAIGLPEFLAHPKEESFDIKYSGLSPNAPRKPSIFSKGKQVLNSLMAWWRVKG